MKVYYYEACGWPSDDPGFLEFCEERKMNYFAIIIFALVMFYGSLFLEQNYCKKRKW